MSTTTENAPQPAPQSAPHVDTGAHKNTTKRLLKLKNRLRRNITINAICIVLALFGIYWASHFFWRHYQYEVTNDAIIDQYITPLNIRVAGYIKSVNFTEHQWVNEGDTLVVLDDSEFRIKLKDAEAALKDAYAASEVLSAGIGTSRSNISVSEANIAEVQAKLRILEQDYIRYGNLLAEESVSQQQYDQAKSDYEAMRARYESLLRQKESTTSQANEVSKKSGSIEANIMRKEAELDMARLNLSYTVVTAPFGGYMGRRTLEKSQFVQSGQLLSNIIKGSQKWITANYKETQIANIYIGQPVNIIVDAFNGQVFHGKVTAISDATGSKYSLIPTDNSAGNFVKIQQRIPVRIEFDDISAANRDKLRAGMMVETEAKIKP